MKKLLSPKSTQIKYIEEPDFIPYEKRQQRHQAAKLIQKVVRGRVVRSKVKKMKEAARSIQKVVRGRSARRKKMNEAARSIQKIIRGRSARKKIKQEFGLSVNNCIQLLLKDEEPQIIQIIKDMFNSSKKHNKHSTITWLMVYNALSKISIILPSCTENSEGISKVTEEQVNDIIKWVMETIKSKKQEFYRHTYNIDLIKDEYALVELIQFIDIEHYLSNRHQHRNTLWTNKLKININHEKVNEEMLSKYKYATSVVSAIENFDLIKKIFKHLKHLKIDNQFEPLGESFKEGFENLKSLQLDNFNQPLEDSLSNLKNLEELDFPESFQQPLEDSLHTLTKLKTIRFRGKYNQQFEDALNGLKLEHLELDAPYNFPLEDLLLHPSVSVKNLHLRMDSYNHSLLKLRDSGKTKIHMTLGWGEEPANPKCYRIMGEDE